MSWNYLAPKFAPAGIPVALTGKVTCLITASSQKIEKFLQAVLEKNSEQTHKQTNWQTDKRYLWQTDERYVLGPSLHRFNKDNSFNSEVDISALERFINQKFNEMIIANSTKKYGLITTH